MASENAKLIDCEICGYNRAIQRCHIVPMRLLKLSLIEIGKEFKSYSGVNILHLCANCHWAFDHFLLTKDEFEKIKDKVMKLSEIYTQVLRGPLILKWLNSWNNFIEKHYANT